jgi:hypothetical protein
VHVGWLTWAYCGRPRKRRRAILKSVALSAILLVACAGAAAAKNTVLHCRGYQVGDRHRLTDQIISLDMENNIVVSIQLGGANPKDVVNAQIIKINKNELQWSYEAVNKKYVFNPQTSGLRLLSNTLELIGIFECSTS